MLLRFLLSALLPLAASALVAEKEPKFQTTSPLALAFVGAQHWVESGQIHCLIVTVVLAINAADVELLFCSCV
jgi:hypothetical protein